MLSTIFFQGSPGGLKISGSDTMSQAVISVETEIFLFSLQTLKKVIPFCFLKARSPCTVSLLRINGFLRSSAFAAQLCPSHRAPDPSTSLGLKHNLEFRHFLLNWGKSPALSQHAVTEEKRDHQASK